MTPVAVVIPYRGDHDYHLYKTVHYWSKYADVYVVSGNPPPLPSHIHVIEYEPPPPRFGLARHYGYKYVLEAGKYDVVINSDSHVWSTVSPKPLIDAAVKHGWASSPHIPILPNEWPLPLTSWWSYITVRGDAIYWCFAGYQQYIHMTNEPVIAYRADTLEYILPYYNIYATYALDHVALMKAPPGVLIKEFKFYHVTFPRQPRRPTCEEAKKFLSEYWPSVKAKSFEPKTPRCALLITLRECSPR